MRKASLRIEFFKSLNDEHYKTRPPALQTKVSEKALWRGINRTCAFFFAVISLVHYFGSLGYTKKIGLQASGALKGN